MRVDFIEIDGTRYQTEDRSTLSTGTWQGVDQYTPGFLQTELLHTNGYFQYSSSGNGSGGGGNQSNGNFALSTSQISVRENAGTVSVSVRRLGSTAGAASIDYTVVGDTATEVEDFEFRPVRFDSQKVKPKRRSQ